MPATVKDPVWSLQPWPVEVIFAGTRFEMPPLPAAEWLQVLLADDMDLADIFPGWLSEEEQELINDALFDGVVDMDQLYETCLELVTTVSGRPWWVALRLVSTARASWQVLGAEMLLKGVDASVLSLSGWLDVLLLLVMRNIDPKEAMMFTLKLEQPPPGVETKAPEPEMSASAFLSMA